MSAPSQHLYDSPPNTAVCAQVPAGARAVLDLGCGTGANAAEISRAGILVDGITVNQDEARLASRHCRTATVWDLERGLPPGDTVYDCVTCSHVLEHIAYPEPLFRDLHRVLQPGGRLIVALPNLLYYVNRLRLLMGHFDYTDSGLMDYGHVRWYTVDSFSRFLAAQRLTLLRVTADGAVPLPYLRRWFGLHNTRLDRWGATTFPGLFGYQLLFVAEIPLAAPPVSPTVEPARPT